jgi:hypothetical protein
MQSTQKTPVSGRPWPIWEFGILSRRWPYWRRQESMLAIPIDGNAGVAQIVLLTEQVLVVGWDRFESQSFTGEKP